MTDKNDEVRVLPLITLRGLTVLPNATVQIIAGREKSIQALNVADQSETRQIAVFSQLDDNDENPEKRSIQQFGTLCTVLSIQPKSDKNLSCFIKGNDRIKLVEILDDDIRYRKVSFKVVKDLEVKKKDAQEYVESLRVSLDSAIERSEDTVSSIIDNSVSSDAVARIRKETDIHILTDLLTQILVMDPSDKRMILETLDPVERANVLICRLNNYSYKAEVLQKIVDNARASMDKHQKEYFLSEQLKAIKKELSLDHDSQSDIEEYKTRLKEEQLPEPVRKRLKSEINKLNVNIHNSENSIIRNYIDTLFNIPWYKKSEINRDLSKARDTLEHDHYGLEKVKDRILEYLAVQSRQDKLHGPIMCLMGPPGIGKTSLGASIARATGRTYVRIALGGLHDEAEIRGDRRTYIGAMPGKIIQQLIKCGVNNPLLLLDEIDKVSVSNHGDPASALLEVLDPEQNKAFSDNYVDLDYDLSNVMFIATANTYRIEKPLLDRMEIIDLSSYTEDEKFHIAKEHLIGKQLKENNLSADEIEFRDAAIRELITYYTHEAGVRGLERLINELCRKSVKDIMLSKRKRKGKIIIDAKSIKSRLGPRRYDFTSKLSDNKVGIVNGLAWTSLGGDILQVEAVANEGTGKHQLTGKLGEVMKESISAAMTVVRSRADELKLDPGFFAKCDLHVHVPEGATPKEGPSAGIGMVTAIVSAITGNEVRSDVAMTGEITLRGDVLPIGGLKEKLLAALRGGIKTALIPSENEKDLYEIPKIVKDKLEIVMVKRIDEVLRRAMVNDPFSFTPKTCFALKKKSSTRTRKDKDKDSKPDSSVPAEDVTAETPAHA